MHFKVKKLRMKLDVFIKVEELLELDEKAKQEREAKVGLSILMLELFQLLLLLLQ